MYPFFFFFFFEVRTTNRIQRFSNSSFPPYSSNFSVAEKCLPSIYFLFRCAQDPIKGHKWHLVVMQVLVFVNLQSSWLLFLFWSWHPFIGRVQANDLVVCPPLWVSYGILQHRWQEHFLCDAVTSDRITSEGGQCPAVPGSLVASLVPWRTWEAAIFLHCKGPFSTSELAGSVGGEA